MHSDFNSVSPFQSEATSTSEPSSIQSISSDDFRKKPVVVVDWYDAVCTGGTEWQDLNDMVEALETGPSLVRSVGMLVCDEDTNIALIDTLILDGDACGYVHVIPRGMVHSMTEVWSEQS